MVILALNFGFELNVSLQVGDAVYFTNISPDAGFMTNSNVTKHLGQVESIVSPTEITVRCPYVDDNNVILATHQQDGTAHISFSKNRFINNNNLLGYYGSVVFKNDSLSKVELFSVGSEVSESSK